MKKLEVAASEIRADESIAAEPVVDRDAAGAKQSAVRRLEPVPGSSETCTIPICPPSIRFPATTQPIKLLEIGPIVAPMYIVAKSVMNLTSVAAYVGVSFRRVFVSVVRQPEFAVNNVSGAASIHGFADKRASSGRHSDAVSLQSNAYHKIENQRQ